MRDDDILQNDSPSGEVEGAFNVTTPYFTDYQILSSGDTHVIYKARRYGRYYVLKGLVESQRSNPAQIEWLYKEYCIGVSLNHPNVVRVESIEDDPVVGRCIVMEYIEGVPVSTWVRSHRRRSQRERVLRQLLGAVSHCHSRQVCHRDIKPANVLVTEEGDVVKLIDFGLADGPQYAAFKQAGGTVGWAAPEQVEGLPVHAEADIYAVGKLMRELMPHQFRRAARHAVRQNPKRRPPSADALALLLRRRRGALLAIETVLLLATLGGVLYLLLGDKSPQTTTVREIHYTDLTQDSTSNLETDRAEATPADLDVVYTVTLPSGQTIRYKVLSHRRREVVLVEAEGTDNLPTGRMTVPATLTHNNAAYNIVSIGKRAFANCTGLTSVKLPNGLLRIEDEAFRGCRGIADTLRIPATLKWIGIDAFKRCEKLPHVVWSAQMCKGAGQEYKYYFSDCSHLRSVEVTAGVKALPANLFGWMESLSSATISEGVTALPDNLFSRCLKLKKVTLPHSLKTIGIQAFECCPLEEIHIPDLVRIIDRRAFYLCIKLQRVYIGKSVQTIGKEAFWYDSQIKQMTIASPQPPELGDDALLLNPTVKLYWDDLEQWEYVENIERPTLYVPEGLQEAYRQLGPVQRYFSEVKPLSARDR